MNTKAMRFLTLAQKANTREFNILKVVEECSELSEVLVKTLTKKGANVPSNDKIIEELCDVMLRCDILAEIVGKKQVLRRILEKRESLYVYYLGKLKPKS